MAPYARHGVNVNVDFYSGVVYHLLGIKRDLFVPIFAIGRMPGWVVQVLEQIENNILIRPLTPYCGPEPRSYRPINARDGGRNLTRSETASRRGIAGAGLVC